MKINDIKIGLRLSILVSLSVVVVLGGVGLYLYEVQAKKKFEETDVLIGKQIADFEIVILEQIKQSQKRVKLGLGFAEYYLKEQGGIRIQNSKMKYNAVNQVSQDSREVWVNKWTLNNKLVQNSNSIVDNIKEYTKEPVTIFQRIDGGYLRIATNIMTKEGERAVGTYIPASSPVIKSIEKGETFYGRAFVVSDWYVTAYRPIYIKGKVEGIIFVGTPENDITTLKQMFNDRVFLSSGYPYLVDRKGTLLIHPTAEGSSVDDEEVFKKMVNASDKVGYFHYNYKGVDKYQYYRYIEEIDAYIAGAVTEKELLAGPRFIRNIILISMLFGTILVVLLVTFISNNISRNLNRAVYAAESIASGDLTAKLDIDQKDEIGILAQALNKMIDSLNVIVAKIHVGADNISSASQQLSSSSQELSQGANEQAASIEQVSSTVEEITANIHQSTNNANQTAKVSEEANKGVSNVSERSQEAVNANKTIAEKIMVINAIADKTDLLAINASIEAARAGEHGKGFAVVAAEVRKLAENSQAAADEIVKLAETSLDLSTKAGEVMDGTIPKIEKAFLLVQEIAAAGNEQSVGVGQVNDAIQQLNNVTQQNASASEELASSAQELSSQALVLKDVISFFQTGHNNPQTIRKNKQPSKVNVFKNVETKTEHNKVEKDEIPQRFFDIEKDNDYTSF